MDDGKSQELPEQSQRFLELLEEVRNLYLAKQADYSGDEDPYQNYRKAEGWGVPAWVACMVRVEDKISRLQNLAQGRELTTDSVQNSFLDIAVGAINAMVLWEEQGLENMPDEELPEPMMAAMLSPEYMKNFSKMVQHLLRYASKHGVPEQDEDQSLYPEDDGSIPPPTNEEIEIHMQEQDWDRRLEAGEDPEVIQKEKQDNVQPLFRPEVTVQDPTADMEIPEEQVEAALWTTEVPDLDETEVRFTKEMAKLKRIGEEGNGS